MPLFTPLASTAKQAKKASVKYKICPSKFCEVKRAKISADAAKFRGSSPRDKTAYFTTQPMISV